MKQLWMLFFVLVLLSCNSNNETRSQSKRTMDSLALIDHTDVTDMSDSMQALNPGASADTTKPPKTDVGSNEPKSEPKADKDKTAADLPKCVQGMIVKFMDEKKQNPARKIYSYRYNQQTMYYVPAICCDFYSDLYDASCNLIGHPDGGYTGKGDGKMPDFMKTATNKELLWADKR